MVDAPERIWATGSFDRSRYAVVSWNATKLTNTRADYGEVEYVRADLYEQVMREKEAQEKLKRQYFRSAQYWKGKAEAAERLVGAIRELIASYRERFTDEKVDYQRGILDTLDNVEMVLAGTHDDANLTEPKPVGVDDDPPENWFNYRSVTTEPAGEAEPVAWMDSTGSEIHPIIKNYQKEDMIRNGGVQSKRAVHYSIALYTK